MLMEVERISLRTRKPLMTNTKCRILCVDDHLDTSEMLQLLLAEEDYEVRTAGTIEEASAIAQSEEFDLYVLDKRLPEALVSNCAKLLTSLLRVFPVSSIPVMPTQYTVRKHFR